VSSPSYGASAAPGWTAASASAQSPANGAEPPARAVSSTKPSWSASQSLAPSQSASDVVVRRVGGPGEHGGVAIVAVAHPEGVGGGPGAGDGGDEPVAVDVEVVVEATVRVDAVVRRIAAAGRDLGVEVVAVDGQRGVGEEAARRGGARLGDRVERPLGAGAREQPGHPGGAVVVAVGGPELRLGADVGVGVVAVGAAVAGVGEPVAVGVVVVGPVAVGVDAVVRRVGGPGEHGGVVVVAVVAAERGPAHAVAVEIDGRDELVFAQEQAAAGEQEQPGGGAHQRTSTSHSRKAGRQVTTTVCPAPTGRSRRTVTGSSPKKAWTAQVPAGTGPGGKSTPPQRR
jgi:hypothetical protein